MKSEHLVLPRPLGGHVGEAGHSHAMRQPPRDGRFHEIGRQEGKRDALARSRRGYRSRNERAWLIPASW
jgi:hypothetical protein